MFDLLAAASSAPDVSNEMMGEMVGGLLIVACGFLLVFAIVGLVFLWLIYSAARVADPSHQSMSPGLVWLLLIPLFNLFWMFKVFPSVADSLSATARDRGHDVGGAGRGIGMSYCIVVLISTVVSFFSGGMNPGPEEMMAFNAVDGITSVLSFVALILLIVYVVKIQGAKKIILASGN